MSNILTTGDILGRMTPRLKESMLIRLLRQPELFAEAKTLLLPEHFVEGDEIRLGVLWRAMLDVSSRYGRLEYETLADTVDAMANDMSPPLSEIEIADLLCDDPDEPGIVYHSLFVADPAEMQLDHGRQLVRRFLEERLIADPLRDAVMSMAGGISTDFGSLLQELKTRRDQITAVDVNPVHVGVPDADDWGGEAIKSWATGIDFLDDPMGGGNVCGEMHGLLGPSGVGKTTLACMMAFKVASFFYQLRQETGEHRIAYIFSYEQTARQLRAKILACAAEISLTHTVLKMTNPRQDLSRNTADSPLKPYEVTKFKGLAAESVRSEWQRYQDCLPIVRDHIRIIDMSGGSNKSRAGVGYVDEMVSIIDADISASSLPIQPGWFIADYAQLIAHRHLQAKKGRVSDNMLRHLVGQIGDEMKQKLCIRFDIPGWILSQFNTKANKASPSTPLTHNDAGEAGNFAHPIAFCFCLGTKDQENSCTLLNPSKTRYADGSIPPMVIKIDGDFSTMRRADNEYIADTASHRILSRDVRNQFAGEAAEAATATAEGEEGAPAQPARRTGLGARPRRQPAARRPAAESGNTPADLAVAEFT